MSADETNADASTLRRVLVLCTGNSCRSIMAEALIEHVAGDRWQAVSAGSAPTGRVHPGALATLERHGIDPGTPASESWDSYADEHFDLVITVCDAAASEPCPVFSGPAVRLHWSTPDPAAVTGDPEEIEAAFEQAFASLERRVRETFT